MASDPIAIELRELAKKADWLSERVWTYADRVEKELIRPVANTDLRDRIENALLDVSLETNDEQRTYETLAAVAFREVAPVLAAKDAETERIRIRLADAFHVSHAFTLDQMVDDIPNLMDMFTRSSRETVKLRREVDDLTADAMQLDVEMAQLRRDLEAAVAARDLLRAERDELRAHGVYKDIGQANSELRAELSAARMRVTQLENARLFWLPEFGDDEEIGLGEPVVHNRADGRFVLRVDHGGQPDTEATEQAAPVWKIEVEIPARVADSVDVDGLFRAVADAVHEWEPADREGWDVSVSAMNCGRVQPATSTEPRVWHSPNSTPPSSTGVLDQLGARWTPLDDGQWCHVDETLTHYHRTWSYVVTRYGPLTEVSVDQAGGGEP